MDVTTASKTDRPLHHPRVEDNALVRGLGRYAADAPLPNQTYAYFVRSPHAFARIVSIDVRGAAGAPGVGGVLTARDWKASAIWAAIRRFLGAPARHWFYRTG